MFQLLIIASVFVCAASLAAAVAFVIRNRQDDSELSERLQDITRNGGRGKARKQENVSVLLSPLNNVPNQLEKIVSRYFNVRRHLDQAGSRMETNRFITIVAFCSIGAAFGWYLLSPWKIATPVFLLLGAMFPLGWLWFKRRKRMKRFGAQLPDALELMARALRAGHSLPAGIQLVATQMSDPIGPEFSRCYEEQNLGSPMDQAIRQMTERVPNVDLKFFATAVILQRQTGGDLAEILNKIGLLIRERFTIWGQIQALTGEGRLSGIVLLALPPILFCVMLRLNYDYVMMLFNDPLGRKMLVAGIISQIIGAIVIKKIITIKV
jgi:tight adherence protein B